VPDKQGLQEMKDRYTRGGLGDAAVKRRLIDVLLAHLEPIRRRREEFAKDPAEVMNMLRAGTNIAREVASKTLHDVRGAMTIDYFDRA